MKKLVLIDGNSILNRAFYGIMGSKMLMTKEGMYTNAIYGFLAILFKILEEIKPEYMVVAFDLKAPTARHKLYEGYKATRKGMPDELAQQMPMLKEILEAMHIQIIERSGYEADDVLGTLSVYGEKKGLEVIVVSGDRDTFQLATNQVMIHIPRTKMGKTEVDHYDQQAIKEQYGILPKQLIEVKGLQGDTSDNIPGVPGIGEKTALNLIKQYGSIDAIYEAIEKEEDDLKGKARENLIQYKEQAYLSRTLGTINLEVPIQEELESFLIEEWDKKRVYEIFKELNFSRFMERFGLAEEKEVDTQETKQRFTIVDKTETEILEIIQKQGKLFYYFSTKESANEENIVKREISKISVYHEQEKQVYELPITQEQTSFLRKIFEDSKIEKYGYQLAEDSILLLQIGIKPENFAFDAEVACYDINPSNIKYHLEEVAKQYLDLDMKEYLESQNVKQETQTQMNLFEQEQAPGQEEAYERQKDALYVYVIAKLYEVTSKQLKEAGAEKLFQTIEMPLVEVLAQMQYNGMYVDKEELQAFGAELKQQLEIITKEIYELSGEEFNINSTKQLGEVLFEKLNLPMYKKTKSGYSTDVDVLEKLKPEHPVIEKILEYRSLAKLNSTYVEGLIPYINQKTKRIHSYFHQTITATGRISSTEPNLQNIPTRIELGKRLRKVFKPAEGCVFIDADYSQIELRILAHISEDENMIHAFLNHEDIHKQAASKVLNIPIEEVTSSQRSQAKAVNFGIVYGISDFGLAGQLGVSRKQAKEYITQYLEKYSGIKKFMDDIVEQGKENGYVETLYHRRRYIPEMQSTNYMVRQFGARVAMNTPIQGTAADIMKIAMIDVYFALQERKLKAKIVLQVHDELLIEAPIEEKEEVKKILQDCMEKVITLKVPLEAEVSEANNWYEAK